MMTPNDESSSPPSQSDSERFPSPPLPPPPWYQAHSTPPPLHMSQAPFAPICQLPKLSLFFPAFQARPISVLCRAPASRNTTMREWRRSRAEPSAEMSRLDPISHGEMIQEDQISNGEIRKMSIVIVMITSFRRPWIESDVLTSAPTPQVKTAPHRFSRVSAPE